MGLLNKRKGCILNFFHRLLLTTTIISFFSCGAVTAPGPADRALERIQTKNGVCLVLGDSDGRLCLDLASRSELLIYLQLPDGEDVDRIRRVVDEAGFYGSRIYIEKGDFNRIQLADNLADVVIGPGDLSGEARLEVLRVLNPLGIAQLGDEELVKPFPEGIDEWSHPYHGPDNNPQSLDRIARAPYLTQFLAEPYYAPLPQVAVSSAGRVFKAFGNISFHLREEALLNTLVAFNGYNGTILWKRPLSAKYMIHRSTMVATPETLYLADNLSCKLIDTASGTIKDEIVPDISLTGGTLWKWMALESGTLFALVGREEYHDPTIRQRSQVHGWPWDPLSKGFNQAENPWGFGHNLLAIDPGSKKILWHHHEEEQMDSRALCLKDNRIYLFRFGSYLACLQARDGKEIWRKTPANAPELFRSLGNHLNRQDWRTNWRTTAYLKCSQDVLYFAGPPVGKLLAVSSKDGSVLWENSYNNFQLVIREEGLYGISGEIDKHKSVKFDPLTGAILAELDTKRRACTRPNGSIDAIFFRASGGSIRLDTSSNRQQWISPMRPQCHDGVTIANGLLYWWPSVCDCQNTFYGFTALGPAGSFDFNWEVEASERLEVSRQDIDTGSRLVQTDSDWPMLRADSSGTATTSAVVPENIRRLWWLTPENENVPTAPIAVGELVFFAGSDSIVRALNAGSGEPAWKAYTGGPIRFPPTYWNGRLYVGSGDGWVYAYDAVSGSLLWRFNAAPRARKIPVYGKLTSTWPVASGVLVRGGIAYLAAGIANYDGVHVYALDAQSGEIVWQNHSSGHLDPESRTGVSVQGHMLIARGKLYLASGTSLSPAVFDLKDGSCLNDPELLKACASNNSRGWELFRIGDRVVVGGQPMYGDPDYPVYDTTVTSKMLHTSASGLDVVWINNSLMMAYKTIDKEVLHGCVADPNDKTYFMNIGWGRFDVSDLPLWEQSCQGSVAFARAANVIVFASEASGGTASIDALDINSGRRIPRWGRSLPGSPVPWGLAIDREGRTIVTLRNGQILCFGR